MCNGLELATGTGFVVQHDGQPYLITNYHVAAGRNPDSGQPRRSSGAVPDSLRVSHLMPPRSGHTYWEPRDERVLEPETDRACGYSTLFTADASTSSRCPFRTQRAPKCTRTT